MFESFDLYFQVKNSDISVLNKESFCGEFENKIFYERKFEFLVFCGLEIESLIYKEIIEFLDGLVCGGGCIFLGEVVFLMFQYLDESVCVGIWIEMEVVEGCIDQFVYQFSIIIVLNYRY